jgi:hypothetical protein
MARRRTVLLDSPVSRLGYVLATAWGCLWGFLWSTGEVQFSHGLIIFTGMPKWSFGRGGVCVGGAYLTRSNTAPGVLEHEAVHKRQWQRYGILMPLLYLLAGRNPYRNRFEIEAGLERGGYRSPR